MLGGIDPIIIFQFSKLAPSTDIRETLNKIPVISQIPTIIDQPPIPVYLSETFGLQIDSEDKNIDIETDIETLTNGQQPDTNQKGIASTVTINITAKKDSVGLILLASLLDLVFDRTTSKEYAITYMHGATTIFRGLLHTFSINQNATNDLALVKIELSRGTKNPQKLNPTPIVAATSGTLSIDPPPYFPGALP